MMDQKEPGRGRHPTPAGTTVAHEGGTNGSRVAAWRDRLNDEEQAHVDRLAEMPLSMALGYIWVEFNRQLKELREEHRRALGTSSIAKNVASGVGGGCMVILAMVGHALGWDEVVR